MVKTFFLVGVLLLGGGSPGGGADDYHNADDRVQPTKVAYVAVDADKDVSRVAAKNTQKDADNLIPFPLWAALKAAHYSVEGVEPVPCPVWMLHSFAKLISDKK